MKPQIRYAIFFGLLLSVWLSSSTTINIFVPSILVVHILFNKKKIAPTLGKLSWVGLCLSEFGMSNGAAGAVALVAVMSGCPSRSANFDAAIWTYGFAFTLIALPLVAVSAWLSPLTR